MLRDWLFNRGVGSRAEGEHRRVAPTRKAPPDTCGAFPLQVGGIMDTTTLLIILLIVLILFGGGYYGRGRWW